MDHLQPSEEHLKILRERFGCHTFKDDQWKVIRSVMFDKRDTSIVASTGFGKSLTYQYPPVFMEKIAIVISPLISLMHDQVASLQERGISATFFCSEQADKTIPSKFENYNVIYLTPEALLNDPGKFYHSRLVQSNIGRISDKICLIAIDEAHVVDQWSDFRPIYKSLYKLKEQFPGIPIMTLTATSPKYIENVIVNTLRLQNPFTLRTALNRSNLRFEVRSKINNDHLDLAENALRDLLPILNNHDFGTGSIIVYVIRISDAKVIAAALNNQGIVCKPYHSEVKPAAERKKTLDDFRSGSLKLVVCTIAFGMGIDRPDVRKVIHYGMPRTIEGYYQEAGRAGRDGKKSDCLLFQSSNDYDLHTYLIKFPNHGKGPISLEFQNEQLKLLNRMVKFVHSKRCRRIEMLEYLEAKADEIKKININDECCDNCSKVLNDGTSIPPHLLYEGMNIDSTIDLSAEIRLLLLSINRKMKISDTLHLLLGKIPPYGVHKCELTTFGMGTQKQKEKDWWHGLVLLIISCSYLIVANDTVLITKKGKNFLRNMMQKAILQPNRAMQKFMQKRNDIDLFWAGNEVKSRPKLNQISDISNTYILSPQDLMIIQETLNLDVTDLDDSNDDSSDDTTDITILKTLEGLEDEFLEEIQIDEPPCKIQKLS